jgi:hypothetical protein
MIEVYHEPKREVELAFCDILNDNVELIRFFPNYGDEARETPFGAVVCEEINPLMGGARPRGYLCNVKVVFVSHIDEAASQEHAGYIAQIEDALNAIANGANSIPSGQPHIGYRKHLRREELYGYDISFDSIQKVKDHLRTLRRQMATVRIQSDDPILLAKQMREGIYAATELTGASVNIPKYKDFVILGSHYTFEPEEKVLVAKYTNTILEDRYILVRRHVQIAGLYINSLSTKAQDQSFGDIFDCKVGVTEIC